MNNQLYVKQMTAILAPHVVIVSFVTSLQESLTDDSEQKVLVEGNAKSCRGFISQRDNRPHILCNVERYPTSGEDQYKLIHHEYAGLAGVEKNVGASSDYTFSNQVSKNLISKVIKCLPITDEDDQNAKEQVETKKSEYGEFYIDDAQAKVIKEKIKTKLLTPKFRNLVGKECGWNNEGADEVFEGLNPNSLVLLPVAQNWQEDVYRAPTKTTVYTDLLVSGLGHHLGNRGQGFAVCVLKVGLTSVYYEKSNKITSEVEVVGTVKGVGRGEVQYFGQ